MCEVDSTEPVFPSCPQLTDAPLSADFLCELGYNRTIRFFKPMTFEDALEPSPELERLIHRCRESPEIAQHFLEVSFLRLGLPRSPSQYLDTLEVGHPVLSDMAKCTFFQGIVSQWPLPTVRGEAQVVAKCIIDPLGMFKCYHEHIDVLTKSPSLKLCTALDLETTANKGDLEHLFERVEQAIFTAKVFDQGKALLWKP